jgi:DNA-binding transcriptional ArsR family regulator
MTDRFSDHYADLLEGQYDCVDRIVLNAYFPLGQRAGGFRTWWRLLNGGDETLDDTHLMRMAGRFSRRVRAFAKARGIPVVFCAAGTRKHELAREYLAQHPKVRGVFMILIARAPAPVWEVERSAAGKIQDIARPKSLPYVNHLYFHILDPEWGHVTIKMCVHPPFNAQILLNGHEYVACQARRKAMAFTQADNCFTQASNLAGLARVAETLSESRTIGRLTQVCERWIYTSCLCFGLNTEEQEKTNFRYHYSVYQTEYSRNLLFQAGGKMDQVFQALIDRNRGALGLDQVKTLFGCKKRPCYRKRKGQPTRWGVLIEKPTYDLTVFKVHFGKLTLKIYTKGERVLRIEAIVQNTRALPCNRSLPHFPTIVALLRGRVERFLNALQGLDVCFIADDTLEQLPLPSQVGKTRVGGINFHQLRMRRVTEALLALSGSPGGFTASDLASRVRVRSGPSPGEYSPRHAAYDLKKFRAKHLVRKIESSRRYEVVLQGLRAMSTLVVLRDRVIKPLLAAACQLKRGPKPKPCTTLDRHYETLRKDMRDLFEELRIAP